MSAPSSEPAARTVGLVALVVAALALVLSGVAIWRAEQYRAEIQRLGDVLTGGGAQGMQLDPIPRPPEADPDPR